MSTRKISRRKSGVPTIAFEEISPEDAFDLLASNNHNRKLRQKVVEKYARDMRDGNWLYAGEPILLDSEGKMIGNGQHRLMAVIEADVVVSLPIMRNASQDERLIVDQGAKRSFGDVLQLNYNETDPVKLAAAVRQVRQYRVAGQFGLTGFSEFANPSIAELLDTYKREGQEIKLSIPIQTRLQRATPMKIAAGLTVAMAHIFTEIDPDESEIFWERLIDGDHLEVNDAIWHIRRYFSSENRPRWVRQQSAVLIKAFNIWREGRQVGTLRWRAGGRSPEKYPMIDPALENGVEPVEPVDLAQSANTRFGNGNKAS